MAFRYQVTHTDLSALLRKRIESTRYLDEDFNSSNTEETLSGVQTPNLIFEIPPEKATAA